MKLAYYMKFCICKKSPAIATTAPCLAGRGSSFIPAWSHGKICEVP